MPEEPGRTAPAFLADCHLGKLAKRLRLLGFDTLFFSSIDDGDLVALAREQGRILLTRDRELSRRKGLLLFFLEAADTDQQLLTLIRRYRLAAYATPFSRCLVCNTPLESAQKEQIASQLPETVHRRFDAFMRCPGCGRLYWHGDHYRRMKRYLEGLLKRSGTQRG